MALLTLWTWIWVSSGSWWWTGKPVMLQSMGSQRVGNDWATELNWWTMNLKCNTLISRRQWPGSHFYFILFYFIYLFIYFGHFYFNLTDKKPRESVLYILSICAGKVLDWSQETWLFPFYKWSFWGSEKLSYPKSKRRFMTDIGFNTSGGWILGVPFNLWGNWGSEKFKNLP